MKPTPNQPRQPPELSPEQQSHYHNQPSPVHRNHTKIVIEATNHHQNFRRRNKYFLHLKPNNHLQQPPPRGRRCWIQNAKTKQPDPRYI
ncbi:hypothetical protein QL285_026826 [Trifolium repens]|nr:hypothetical protein QL285_026826 [Trifolium repens]